MGDYKRRLWHDRSIDKSGDLSAFAHQPLWVLKRTHLQTHCRGNPAIILIAINQQRHRYISMAKRFRENLRIHALV